MQQEETIDTSSIVPPYGGKVISMDIPRLSSSVWEDGVRSGGPATRPDDAVWTAGKYFPLYPDDIFTSSRLILMWAGEASELSPSAGQRWGNAHGLRKTHPLEVFALSAACPQVYKRFRFKGAGLVPTQFQHMNGKPHVPCVWQSEKHDTRWASLRFANEELGWRTIFVFGERAVPPAT